MSIFGKMEVNNYSFTWTIDNFSTKCEKIKDFITSPIFSAAESQWQLELYPYGDCEQAKDHLSLFLLPIKNSPKQLVNFKFSLLNNIREETNAWETTIRFDEYYVSWGCRLFMKRSLLMNEKDTCLMKDQLIILCMIHCNPFDERRNKQEIKVTDDFAALLSTGMLSDVTINVGKKKLKAHKNILAARSTVFAAMFDHNMIENKSNSIKVSDISFEVMEEVLWFIYTGKNRNLHGASAKSVMYAADKYNLATLKIKCEEALWRTLDVENACDILVGADLYNCKKLKLGAIKFILANKKKVINTVGFRELKDSNSMLLEELFCAEV